MNEKIKEKVDYGFWGAIWIILIAGLIAGIVCGNALKAPTEEALEAIIDLSDTSSYEYRYDYKETYEIAQQKEWSGTSTLAMFGIWFSSALAAFLLYVKKLQMDITYAICCTVQNVGNKLGCSCEGKNEEVKAEQLLQEEPEQN